MPGSEVLLVRTSRDIEANSKMPLLGNRPNYCYMNKIKLISLIIAGLGVIIGEYFYFHYGLKYLDVQPINYGNIALFVVFATFIPSAACIFVVSMNGDKNDN